MTTLERLQAILMAHYPVEAESLARNAALEGLDIDSLGLMELFFAIEDEFGISVPNDKREVHTVGDLADYIDILLAQQDAPAAPGRQGSTAPEVGRAAQ